MTSFSSSERVESPSIVSTDDQNDRSFLNARTSKSMCSAETATVVYLQSVGDGVCGVWGLGRDPIDRS